ncbi:winged helix-turn-helix domain-containing protein [Xanthobacter autotrophicus]|uniref:winged helix-turn-helix domain-containing protein n=1 Tax=Xanthobacter autotrophicus TaxID=280 RepID=UPI0024A62C2D|nr:winged helix-turn-helix domain-containing protein [Xanthobacter autotrophicus]MDI4655527.1 winged helix-turn-helix domain-containing protein [Xanthobacter autotrophicus]
MATLDIEKLRKVRGLMTGGATEGERAAARSRAQAIAKAAGMTLEVALSKLDTPAQPKPRSFFDGFDEWMEAKEPGYKAREAAKRAERNARDARRRAEVLAVYGSEAALFARTEREALLDAAIAPLATWDHWTDDTGTVHRFAKTLDGVASDFWNAKGITPAIRAAVMGAYPWPITLVEALAEVKEWDQLRWDRGLFCRSGEWNPYREVNCRVTLLEDELETGRPAATWDDVQARFDWKRYVYERTYVDPTQREEPFLERLEADFAFLRANAQVPPAGPESNAANGSQAASVPQPAIRRTNADKRADVLAWLREYPELSDREIARRAGVSPQTVNTHRRQASAAASKANKCEHSGSVG